MNNSYTKLKHFFSVIFFVASQSVLLQGQQGNSLFNPWVLHEIRFYFTNDTFWDSLNHNYDEHIDDSGVAVPYLEATVKIDGAWLDTVGIRQKGLSSHHYSTAKKKPFKVDLNEFAEGQSFDGIKKFNLHNGACDPAMLRDFISYDILRQSGVRAPRVSYCRLYFNDEYWGLYAIIEQVDKTFVEDNFASEDGTLIKNIGWSELQWSGPEIGPYLEDFQLKTNEQEEDWSNFLHFLDVLNNSPDADFSTAIQKVFDVDLYLHVLAVDIMTNNWDSYIDNQRNWYLYHEPEGGQLHWIPWDYNLSLGGDFSFTGTPFPPFDPECYILGDFEFVQTGANTFQFNDKSAPEADAWHWDFGDGTTSEAQHPTHTFSTATGEVNVCLYISRSENGQTCEGQRCKKINLSFDPGTCNTILNGDCPFPPTDPFFQLVVQQDDYCCEDEWDALCSVQYYQIAQGSGSSGEMGVDYDLDFQLLFSNPDKILIDRLLDVPEFRARYLDIACFLLENNFKPDRIFPLIDSITNLIRPAIYEDPNYIFTPDYFEYDAGNGTGGGGGATIPALKTVLTKRFNQTRADLIQVGHDCEAAFSTVGWHDLVINEFLASNNEQSGLADPAGEYEDWIELFNNTQETLDLKNFYLTDDFNQPLKWTFPFGTVINPHGYLIVWADKHESQDGVHANFKLSASGEKLLLRHEDGTIIDSLSFGPQVTNLASARIPNGIGDFVKTWPTFGQKNEIISSTSGTEQISPVKIFPNPASEFVMLDFAGAAGQVESINITNPLGQLHFTEKINGRRQIRIDTANYPPGWYAVEIVPLAGPVRYEKFLVSRSE